MKNLISVCVIAFSVGLSGTAYAQDRFNIMPDKLESSTVVTISPFNASADGHVAIYDSHAGVLGEMLGKARIHAGANGKTRIPLGRTVNHAFNHDVTALLFLGDSFMRPSTAVDSHDFRISRSD